MGVFSFKTSRIVNGGENLGEGKIVDPKIFYNHFLLL
jgi:hypothetical protein